MPAMRGCSSPTSRVDAAAYFQSSAAAAQIWFKHEGALAVKIALPDEPTTIYAAPPNHPELAETLEFTWRAGRANMELPAAGETVLWVDPAVDLHARPAAVGVRFTDSEGQLHYRVSKRHTRTTGSLWRSPT